MVLGELLERVYRSIHDDIVDGTATSGSASSIADTSLASKYQANKFKNWIAFVSRTSDGLSPQNRYGIISAYTTAGTATISSITDAVDAGDKYSFAKGSIPLETLIKLCNDALKGLGRIPLVDISLVLASATTRYSLPIAMKGKRPDLIFFRDSNFARFDSPNWYIEPAAPGSADTLVFKRQGSFMAGSTTVFDFLAGSTIVIHYQGEHPEVTAYNSPISETIPDTLAVRACVVEAFKWKAFPRQKKVDLQNWQQSKQEFEETRSRFPIERPIRDENRVPITTFNGLRR